MLLFLDTLQEALGDAVALKMHYPTLMSAAFCGPVGELTGKQLAGGGGTRATGPGSSSSPVPPEPALSGCALPGRVGSGRVLGGVRRKGRLGAGLHVCPVSVPRISCIMAAHGTLQLVQPDRQRCRVSVLFLQAAGTRQPRAGMETKTMPNAMGMPWGVTNSLYEAGCSSTRSRSSPRSSHPGSVGSGLSGQAAAAF